MPAKKMPDDETVRRLYWDEELTAAEVAMRLGVSPHTVSGFMRRHHIPMRSRQEGRNLAISKGYGRRPATAAKLRQVLRCPACGWAWKPQELRTRLPCPNCGHLTEARRRRGRLSPQGDFAAFKRKIDAWKAAGDPRGTKMRSRAHSRLRRTALLLVGRGQVRCVRCGCDDERLLEVNHVNGGGNRERKRSHLYRQIALLERSVDDLDVRCRVCNALDYLERRFGPLPFSVIWECRNDIPTGGAAQ